MTPIALFVIMIFCAVIGGIIGRRGGHGVAGTCLGFFLNLIGLLILVLWNPQRQAVPPQAYYPPPAPAWYPPQQAPAGQDLYPQR